MKLDAMKAEIKEHGAPSSIDHTGARSSQDYLKDLPNLEIHIKENVHLYIRVYARLHSTCERIMSCQYIQERVNEKQR